MCNEMSVSLQRSQHMSVYRKETTSSTGDINHTSHSSAAKVLKGRNGRRVITKSYFTGLITLVQPCHNRKAVTVWDITWKLMSRYAKITPTSVVSTLLDQLQHLKIKASLQDNLDIRSSGKIHSVPGNRSHAKHMPTDCSIPDQ